MLAVMLGAWKTGMIKVNQTFQAVVRVLTMSVMLLYLVSFGLSFIDIQIPFIHEGGMIGIGFSLFVIGLAAMNLVMDFEMIEQGEQHGLPADKEWVAAFSLLITLVWLYIEILRLVMKLRSND